MMRKWFAANGIAWLLAAVLCIAAPSAFAQDQQDQAPKKTPYTLAEYNAYQAAQGQTDPNAKIQALDDFSTKFPSSSLMPLVYQLYYSTYIQLKNYPKVIEYADKYLAVPDDKILIIPGTSKEKLAGDKLQALYFRAVAFNQSFNASDANANDELTKARQSALDGLKQLDQIPKPAGMTDDQFAQQKKQPAVLFNYTAATAAFNMKDYKDAIDSYKAELAASGNATDQNAAIVYYHMGIAYLSMAADQAKSQPQTTAPSSTPSTPPATPPANPPATPPAGTPPATGAQPAAGAAAASANDPLTDLYMNGFWYLARAIALKGPGEAQMQSYLRAQMFNYEQPACGNLLDDQIKELEQLAGTQADKPTTYSLPSAGDLGKILQASNLLSILTDLQGGGDKAKMTWLAVCGQEIPNVYGKIIDMTPATDSIDFKVFTAATGQEIEAGTTANLDVPVYTSAPAAGAASTTGANANQAQTPPPVQPDAARMKKGDAIKFTGTLVSYDPQPFLLHFDKVTVDPSVIPPAGKAAPKRPHRPGKGRG